MHAWVLILHEICDCMVALRGTRIIHGYNTMYIATYSHALY